MHLPRMALSVMRRDKRESVFSNIDQNVPSNALVLLALFVDIASVLYQQGEKKPLCVLSVF